MSDRELPVRFEWVMDKTRVFRLRGKTWFFSDDGKPEKMWTEARYAEAALADEVDKLRGLLRDVLEQWSGCASMIDPQSWNEWGMSQLYQEAEAALEQKT